MRTAVVGATARKTTLRQVPWMREGAVITYAECLKQAEACVRMAGRAAEEADRELLLRMARRWIDAANQLLTEPERAVESGKANVSQS